MESTITNRRGPELLEAIDTASKAADELLMLASLMGTSVGGIDAAQLDGLALLLTDWYEDFRGLLDQLAR